jgi:hypothetical protein
VGSSFALSCTLSVAVEARALYAQPVPGSVDGRFVARALLLFVLAVVVGRLLLEPTGVGTAVAILLLPMVALIVVASWGWRVAVVAVPLFVAVALTMRLIFVFALGQGWLVVVLLPVGLGAGAIAWQVFSRTDWRGEHRAQAERKGEGGEEE